MTTESSNQPSSMEDRKHLRYACDRCRYHKLRCPRTFQEGSSVDLRKPCSRCVNAGERCITSRRAKVGRPRKDNGSARVTGDNGVNGNDPSSSDRNDGHDIGHHTHINGENQSNNQKESTNAALHLLPLPTTTSSSGSRPSSALTRPGLPGANGSTHVDTGNDLLENEVVVRAAEADLDWPMQRFPEPTNTSQPDLPADNGMLEPPSPSGLDNFSWTTPNQGREDAILDQIMNDPFDLQHDLDLDIDDDLTMFTAEDDFVPADQSRRHRPSTKNDNSAGPHEDMVHFITSTRLPSVMDPSRPGRVAQDSVLQQQKRDQLQQQRQTPMQQRYQSYDRLRHPTSINTENGMTDSALPPPIETTLSRITCFQRLSGLNVRILQQCERLLSVPNLEIELTNEMAPFCQELIDLVHQSCQSRKQRHSSDKVRGGRGRDKGKGYESEEALPVPDSALAFLTLSCYTQILQVFEVALGRRLTNPDNSTDITPPASMRSSVLTDDCSDSTASGMASSLRASLTVHTVTYLLNRIRRVIKQSWGTDRPLCEQGDMGSSDGEKSDEDQYSIYMGRRSNTPDKGGWHGWGNKGKDRTTELASIAGTELHQRECKLWRSAYLLERFSRN